VPIGAWDVAVIDGRGRTAVLPSAFSVSTCSHECRDGNRCTTGDTCGTSGFCEPGTPVADNTNTACTLDCVAGTAASGWCRAGSCDVSEKPCPTPLAACGPR
jgi:hypothetical protein